MAYPDRYKLIQLPNASLMTAAVFWAVQRFTDKQPFESIAFAGYVIAGTIWCWQEIGDGVNIYRRILGALVLLGIASTLYQR